MKSIQTKRNVKAQVPLPTKDMAKTEFAVKHKPNLVPKSKRAK